MGPLLNVSSDRLKKHGIEIAIPLLQGVWFIHCTTAATFFTIYNPQYQQLTMINYQAKALMLMMQSWVDIFGDNPNPK